MKTITEPIYYKDMSDEDFLKLIKPYQIDTPPYVSSQLLKTRSIGSKALCRARALTIQQRIKEGKEILI